MTNEKIAAITAQFTKDIPDGSSLALQQALKNIPDEAYPSIIAIQTKSPVTVILLSIFLGGLGVDRFYIGDIGLGVAKLLLGWLTFGIWPLVDIFLCYKKDETSVKIAKETADCAARRLGFPLVVKESYGSMGTGVMLAENATELEKISLETANKPHLYQQYLSARKGTDVRVIVIGGKVASAMERHNPCDFRSNLALGGTGKEIALSDEFAEAAERAAKILKLDYCGVDLLYGDSGEPYICEVNSNAFFKGSESVTHKNIAKLYAAHIINCINNENNPNNAN